MATLSNDVISHFFLISMSSPEVAAVIKYRVYVSMMRSNRAAVEIHVFFCLKSKPKTTIFVYQN
jgi:hypothetical protein